MKKLREFFEKMTTEQLNEVISILNEILETRKVRQKIKSSIRFW